MKKIITMMMVALVAVSASAASIDWQVALGRNTFKDSKGAALNGTIYLVLADTTFNATTAEEFETQLAAATLGTDTVTSGKSSTSAVTATNNKLVAQSAGGSSYDFAIVVYDAANSQYYMSATASQYAYAEGVDDAKLISFTAAQAVTSATWAPTYTAVPEPASAMLALAGVAMLIRRRK
jgi:hypothetical protein